MCSELGKAVLNNSVLSSGTDVYTVLNRSTVNPLFFEPSPGFPPSAVPVNTEYKRLLSDDASHDTSQNLDARVTLPDAGDLFAALPDVIANGAPKHMRDVVLERCMPEWNVQRPYLTGDFLLQAAAKATRPDPLVRLDSVSESEHEALLADDVLYAFLGQETTYLRLVLAPGPAGHLHLVYALDADACACCSQYVQEQVVRLLPIAEAVVLIERFVESRLAFEFGTICHAFAAAVRVLIDDWKLLVPSLEHQLLTGGARLNTLWFHAQPALPTLQLVAGMCAQCSAQRLCGADLLDALHSRAMELAGDGAASRVLQQLLQAATVPYFAMLTKWISRGVLDDPYGEFMVREHGGPVGAVAPDGGAQSGVGADFWLHRFQLRRKQATASSGTDGNAAAADDVPLFLHKVRDVVLKAGKYWSVLRYCAQLPAQDGRTSKAIEYDPHGRYLQAIQQHYGAASAALLRMMLETFELRSWLQTMKSFFLLHRSDYITNFLDAASDELLKNAADVSHMRLKNLLELAVKTSSLARDPHHEDLRLNFDSTSFIALHSMVFQQEGRRVPKQHVGLEQMEALELVMVSIQVPAPITIVLQRWEMRAYEFIFRHLFNSKRGLAPSKVPFSVPFAAQRDEAFELGFLGPSGVVTSSVLLQSVERLLSATWRSLAPVRTLRTSDAQEKRAQQLLMRALSLCHHMLFFVQRYLQFITVEVIEPLWHCMLEGIQGAASLDEVISHHHECLTKILRYGLLERMKSLSTVALIIWNCREFGWCVSDTIARLEEEAGCPPPRAGGAGDRSDRDLMLALSNCERFAEAIGELEGSYREAVDRLLRELKNHKRDILARTGENTDQHTRDQAREEADMLQNFVSQIAYQEV